MLVLEGCYSYQALTREKNGQMSPPPDETIIIHSRDGNNIEVKPYHFVEITQPSTSVYGIGERAEKDSVKFVPFHGKISPIARRCEINAKPDGRGGYRPASRFVFLLQDSSTVRMEESDCIFVDSAQGTGLWYVVQRPDGMAYVGKIPFDNIRSAEVKKVASGMYLLPIAAALTVAALVAGVTLLSFAASNPYGSH